MKTVCSVALTAYITAFTIGAYVYGGEGFASKLFAVMFTPAMLGWLIGLGDEE
jgi:hypothetical protein